MNFPQYKKVSVCILNYNRCDELRKSLAKVFEEGDIWREVIVVDNASTDGTIKMLKSEYPKVEVVVLKENVGISGATFGWVKAKGSWILALDDDSYPVLETLDPVFLAMSTGLKVAAIGLSVKKSWNSDDHKFHGSQYFERGFGFSGAGVLLNKKALEDVGGYGENLFLFTNELDWSARALLRGWGILKSNYCSVVHKSVWSEKDNERYAFYYCRNTFVWLIKYAPRGKLKSLTKSYMRNVLVYTLLHGKLIYIKAIISAMKILKKESKSNRFLTDQQYQSINPNLNAGFSHLS